MGKRFRLTKKTYYTTEADSRYWSASFVKGMMDCPARTLAELRGEYERPESEALLVGSYVDSYFDGAKAFNAFTEEHPQIFNTRTGELKAPYKLADAMIRRAENEDGFMLYLRGRKQRIFTGEIDGIRFKCKLDFMTKDRIVDLKTVKDFYPVYKEGQGKVDFATAWNWPLQLAIYQEIVRQNIGEKLPTYLACITKQDPPDLAVVEIPQEQLDAEMAVLRQKLPLFEAMRLGAVEAPRCNHCAYCRQSRTITRPLSITEFN